MIQAQAAELELAPTPSPHGGRRASSAHRGAERRGARARIHADPARPARRRPRADRAARARRPAARRCAEASHGERPAARRARGARRRRRRRGGARGRRRAVRRRERVALARRARARSTGCWPRTTRSTASCARSTAASCAPRPAATCCARRRCCRPAATCTASIRSASRAPTRCRTARARPSACCDKHRADGHAFPESIAIVLWGTDNLKSEGGPIAPGARADGRAAALRQLRPPRRRRAGAAGRARPAAHRRRWSRCRASSATCCRCRSSCSPKPRSSPPAPTSRSSRNFIRKHALAFQAEHGGDLETAALRVFGNAEGAYGANVNSLIDNSRWDDGDELAETYTRRKGFAYGRAGRPVKQAELLQSVLAGVELAYQNLDSVELGVTTDRHLLRHARRHQPRDQARQGGRDADDGRAGLHRRPDARRRRRRHRAHADRAGRARDAHAHAEPEVVRGHARARLRRRAPDRGARDQHDGLVGHDRPGAAVGLPAAERDLHARPGDARAPRRAQPDRVGPGREPAARSVGPAITGSPTPRCSTRCGAPARNSKTGSKASSTNAAGRTPTEGASA